MIRSSYAWLMQLSERAFLLLLEFCPIGPSDNLGGLTVKLFHEVKKAGCFDTESAMPLDLEDRKIGWGGSKRIKFTLSCFFVKTIFLLYPPHPFIVIYLSSLPLHSILKLYIYICCAYCIYIGC